MALTAQKIDIPGLPSPPISLEEIADLARQQATDSVVEDLRKLADRARRFAADGERWACGIANWPDRLESDPAGVAVTSGIVVDHLLELERSQERGLFPLLWGLEDQRREAEQYPPAARAAWLGFIDPMIKGIREPLDVIRATRFRLQQPSSAACTADAETDRRALIAYQIIASEVFETECAIRIEKVGGEQYYIVDIPVQSPTISYKEQEAKVHSTVERLTPELVGRVVLRYVPQRGAA